eukprot:1180971-Prorocentrum_minimum.AAC.1
MLSISFFNFFLKRFDEAAVMPSPRIITARRIPRPPDTLSNAPASRFSQPKPFLSGGCGGPGVKGVTGLMGLMCLSGGCGGPGVTGLTGVTGVMGLMCLSGGCSGPGVMGLTDVMAGVAGQAVAFGTRHGHCSIDR